MAYKTNITKEFKSKGFINDLELISSEKKDNGATYNIQEILQKIGKYGDEIEFSVKVKEQFDDVEDKESQE